MEMARKFARRFNTMYGAEFFPEPQNFWLSDRAVKIPGLDGSGKMGKSEGNCIYLTEEGASIKKKVMKAVTDQGPQEMNSVRPEVIENLFTLLSVVSSDEVYRHFDAQWNDCTLRYGDLKKQLAADIMEFTAPIRERYLEYISNTALLDRIAREGAERARESASKTMAEVRKIVGFR